MAASLRARPSMAWDMVRYAEPAEFDDVADLLLRANREYRDAMPETIYRAYTEGLRALATNPQMHDDCELLVIGGCGDLMGTVT